MKRKKLVLVALISKTGLVSASPMDNPDKPEQYVISVRVRQGDQLGTREARTIKVLSEATLLTQAGREATFVSDAKPVCGALEEFVGTRLKVTPEALEGEKVRLKLVLEYSELLESGEDIARFRTDRALYFGTIVPGEVSKLKWGKPSERMWVDLSIHDAGQ
jgi:hypothetical protein